MIALSKTSRKMTGLFICFFISFLFINILAQAQNKTITGKITSESGLVLENASVVLKGTSNGVRTDKDGMYIISVPANAKTLVISIVGFETIEVAIRNQSVINADLKVRDNKLDDVVVVGYGSRKKNDVSGAVTQVNSEMITKQSIVPLTKVWQVWCQV
jgi:TonB-dependent starch-binding outer membrane protein SusC